MHTFRYGPLFSCRRFYRLDSVQALRMQPAKAWIRRRGRPVLLQGGFRSSDHGCRQMRFRNLCSCMDGSCGTSAGSSSQVQRHLARVAGRFVCLDQLPLTPVAPGRLGAHFCSRAPDVFESFQDRKSRVHQEDNQLVDLQRLDGKHHPSLPFLSSLSLSKITKSHPLFCSLNAEFVEPSPVQRSFIMPMLALIDASG